MKNPKPQSVVSLDQGRIPPQAIAFEELVLGAMLIDKNAVIDMLGMLSPEVFYKPQHGLIFKSIQGLFNKNKPIDLQTVNNDLQSEGDLEAAGGTAYLIELSNKVSSTANAEYHAGIMLQKHTARELIKISSTTIDKCFDETSNIYDVLEETYTEVDKVSEITVRSEESTLGDLIEPQIEKAVKIGKGEIKPGIPTPFYKLTNAVGGWRESELIILAARPGMGKTAFALKLGIHAAKLGYPTAFFSLEMNKPQLASRIISSESRTNGEKFNRTGLTEEEAHRVAKETSQLKSLPFVIDDTPSISIENLKIRAKQLKSSHGIKLLIIDYLQLMGSKGNKGNREQEVSKISRGLKLIAKELNIPVIALSQLSRAVEARGGDKRPQLSDLRESGSLEQDADMVMFLYRPEYYDIFSWGEEYKQEPTEGEAEYLVSKNRNGGLIRNRMRFEKEFALFSDIEEFNYQPPPISNEASFTFDKQDDKPF